MEVVGSTEFGIVLNAPKVFLVGKTEMSTSAMNEYLLHRHADWNRPNIGDFNRTEAVVEAAGRVCYQSWNNPGKKTTEEYIRTSILDHAHGSVLEHVWLNFMVADIPRSTQLELVRHGDGTAFSFESTRFTDKYMRFVCPPAYRDDQILFDAWYASVERSATMYQHLLVSYDPGETDTATLARKRKKEAARAVLPNSLGSDGMFSCNLRAFRWITEIRSDPSADQSIREFAIELFNAGISAVPSVLSDAEATLHDDRTMSIAYKNRKV